MVTPTTRDTLLDTAETLVRKRGFSATSYADLADAVGIRKASIHHHFPAKADIGVALVDRYIERFDVHTAALAHRYPKLRPCIRAYGEIYAKSLRDGLFCLCGMLAGEAQVLPDPVRSRVEVFFSRQLRWLGERLDAAKKRGELPPGADPKDLAETILGALQGALLVGWALQDPDAVSRRIAAIDKSLRL
jgi:TetR/AcrR family transcriptional regulator, transcriptional repressor for nem operon